MKSIEKNVSCEECILNSKSIFSHLTTEEINELLLKKTSTFYRKGTIIYQETQRMSGIYCVNSGIVKLYKTGNEGREQIIRFAKFGDIIGYRSVLSGEKACTTAKAIEDSYLCFIPSETLFSMIRRNPEFSLNLMQLICKELGEANLFITEIAQKSVRERLAEALIILKNTFKLDNNDVLQISLSREELANVIGTATESVIRLLSEFKDDKLIELNGRNIKILNIKGLMKIANYYE
jgi:CRP/FNR family transcriptional regulator, polysaccharide utilization system transcription regulator